MKIRRIVSLIIALCMLTCLSGCFNRIPGKIWKNPNLEDMFFFIDVMLGDTFLEEVHDNNVITSVKWQKIKLGEYETEKYPALANTFNKYNQDSLTQAQALMYEFSSLAQDMQGDEETPAYCEAESEMHLQRADNYVVSLLDSVFQYTGGAHPDYFVRGINYNTKTGEPLALTDVLTDTADLPALLEKKLLEKYSTVGFHELKDTFSHYKTEDYTWTLDYQGITFWFSPYEIAAYAAGTLSVKIWFDELPELFNKNYMILPSNYAMTIPLGLDVEFDMIPGDGKRDSVYTMETLDQTGSYNMLSVTVNGNTYVDDINYAYDFDVYLVKTGGKYYIYSESVSDGEFYMLNVLDANNGKLDKVDQISDTRLYSEFVEEGFESGTLYTIQLNNPDFFRLKTQFEILGTREAIASFKASDADGTPEMTDDKVYTFVSGHDVTSAIPLEAEILPDMEKTEIPSGTTLTAYQTDGNSFIDMKTADGSIMRIKIDVSAWPVTVNGMDESKCFENLLYAG